MKTVSQVSDSSNAILVSYLENETAEPKEVENLIDKLAANTVKDTYIATGILPPRKDHELKDEKVPKIYTVEHVKYIDGFVNWTCLR